MPVFRVSDVFVLRGGRTVVVGEAAGLNGRVRPGTVASVVLDEAVVGSLRLSGERMPGPGRPRQERSLESDDTFPWDREQVARGAYKLLW